ncbi:MAG: hypothetical protein DI628_07710 [Blastochloris viridis]|uniref:Lipoprotein n=1 Tax=Blastochloris viridis TaxID=1079 RepID=A0A6N4RAR8_BLAVI|nr:MAG: hypothetical protein DI628_07710 [Blastochloris viridis]
MKPTLLLIPALMLTACASVRETYAPDGRKAYMVNCSGPYLSWGECQKAAGKKCGASGYEVLNQTHEEGFQMGANANGYANRYQANYQSSMYGGSMNARTMIIACKQ